jgi:hypothetical protein
MYLFPSIPDFKAYFSRDFPYSDDPKSGVTDADISKAYGQARQNLNESLFANQEMFSQGFLLIAAHYLVIDLRMASQGINGQFSWIESSKSVGSVSQSFSVPDSIMRNPYLAMLSKTNYGAKYLELILPQLYGNVSIAYGRTLP